MRVWHICMWVCVYGDVDICAAGVYVLVISPLGVMLLVYRPDTRGHVAPEGEGL